MPRRPTHLMSHRARGRLGTIRDFCLDLNKKKKEEEELERALERRSSGDSLAYLLKTNPFSAVALLGQGVIVRDSTHSSVTSLRWVNQAPSRSWPIANVRDRARPGKFSKNGGMRLEMRKTCSSTKSAENIQVTKK